MGAPNFHHVGTVNIYAYCMSYVDDETGGLMYPESDEFRDEEDNMLSGLKDAGIKVWDPARRDEHELRSYPSRVLGIAARGNVRIMLTSRSGYHEGACFDLHAISDARDEHTGADMEKYLQDFRSLKADIEKVYMQYSSPYCSIARASNGEEMYEKLNR